MNAKLASAVVAACVGVSEAQAEVVIHTSYASWSAAVGGSDAKVDFNLGFPQALTSQYSALGINFQPNSSFAASSGIAGDGWLALTSFPSGFAMVVDYDAPQFGLGLDLINLFQVTLFWQGSVTYQSPQLNQFGGVFRGISTDSPFDHAIIQSIPGTSTGAIDNLYVANPIPSPAVGAGAIGLLIRVRRRRRPG